jgi:hypothetical protein
MNSTQSTLLLFGMFLVALVAYGIAITRVTQAIDTSGRFPLWAWMHALINRSSDPVAERSRHFALVAAAVMLAAIVAMPLVSH